MPFIRSISGLRATLGDSLLPNVISNYVAAFETLLPKGEVIVGMDGRPSGNWIKKIVNGTLLACSRQVRFIGIVPTPTVQISIEQRKAAGGISITASHNSEEWNGLKFINNEGVFLDMLENTQLWKAEKYGAFNFSKQLIFPEVIFDNYAIKNHIQSVINTPLFTADAVKKIKERKFKVVVDAVNASGSKAIPMLLKKLGCEVFELYCNETGNFPHTPEPLSINLTALAEEVKKTGADLGIAVDPDADRLALINENGEPIGEERTITLATETVLSNINKFKFITKVPVVVVNQSTTRTVDDICEKYGAKLERSAVGEINVVKAMKKFNAVIGGEGSGGVILPSCHYGRDSLVGTALILFHLAVNKFSLSEANNNLPMYNMIKKRCVFHGDLSKFYNAVIEQFPNGKPVKGDGIKILFPESWVQARASNTEPIVRIIAEDQNPKEAKNLVKTMMKICEKM
ncbi:MAG: phosphoglucosamine mutase [bacterium]